jgi:benzoyl-CoA reductase/2-hydroxyglutaryl-CoA dehydratase subunit BcrC/BadD/HgdB
MASTNALQALIQAARAPLQEWQHRYPGYRAMGYLCSYVPEEMIHAAGFAPVRVRGNTDPLRQVDAHLQSFTCALCRSTLDQVLSGELGFLSGTVFAHTCDATQSWPTCGG